MTTLPLARRTSATTAGWIVTGLLTLFLGFDAITHLVREAHTVAFNDEIGAPAWFPVVCGVVLATCLVTYLARATAVLGAVLLTGYFGGACAVNLATGQPLANTGFAMITGALVWLGLWLRDARTRTLVQDALLRRGGCVRYRSTRFGALAQWQSCGLLIRRL
jgi:hypothetical protein